MKIRKYISLILAFMIIFNSITNVIASTTAIEGNKNNAISPEFSLDNGDTLLSRFLNETGITEYEFLFQNFNNEFIRLLCVQ